MEPDDPGLASYYHHHHHHHQQQQQRHPQHHHQPPPPPPPQPSTTTNTPLSPPNNGILPNPTDARPPPQMLYPHNSVPSAVSSPLETGGRRKRGRPRKYGTPEQAAAAKRLSSSSSQSTSTVPPLSPPRKKDLSLGVGSSASTSSPKKAPFGNAGQGFTPHVITVTAGEDIRHRIMLFMQQSKQEICVMSASGSISNASLRQPATSGGNIAYEGRFDILSLCGSYIRTDYGSTTGGLSVCLSSNDGQIIGGSVDGPLVAAGPVQVIVGTFVIEGKKNSASGIKGEASTSKLLSPTVAPPPPSLGFLSAPDPSGRNAVGSSSDQQNIDGYQFMIANTSPRMSDWRNNSDSRSAGGYDFSGRGAHQSSENGDYDHFQN